MSVCLSSVSVTELIVTFHSPSTVQVSPTLISGTSSSSVSSSSSSIETPFSFFTSPSTFSSSVSTLCTALFSFFPVTSCFIVSEPIPSPATNAIAIPITANAIGFFFILSFFTPSVSLISISGSPQKSQTFFSSSNALLHFIQIFKSFPPVFDNFSFILPVFLLLYNKKQSFPAFSSKKLCSDYMYSHNSSVLDFKTTFIRK